MDSDTEIKIGLLNKFDIAFDFLNLFCGKLIGEGNSRVVFEYNLDSRYVVKIEKTESFNNVLEFEFWNSVYHQPEKSKWLTRCTWISTNGKVLIQQKANPVTNKNKHLIPKRVPAFLTDMKFENYGFIGKQFVCFDYPFSANLAMSESLGNKTKIFKSHLNEK